jgi:hypothetical protein
MLLPFAPPPSCLVHKFPISLIFSTHHIPGHQRLSFKNLLKLKVQINLKVYPFSPKLFLLLPITSINMHAIKALIFGALAATASATILNGEVLRREVLHVRAAASSSAVATPYPTATAVTNSSDACSSVLQGLATLITGLPTPTGALYSYLQTAATTLTDPCVSLNFSRCCLLLAALLPTRLGSSFLQNKSRVPNCTL